jgi:uncharacterized membrane protein
MIPKAGYKTTEFVTTLAALAVAALVAVGVLAPEEREGATAALSEAVMAGLALWGALRVVVAYVEGRTRLKEAASPPDTPSPDEG